MTFLETVHKTSLLTTHGSYCLPGTKNILIRYSTK